MASLILAILLIASKQEPQVPAKVERVVTRVDASKQFQYVLPKGWSVAPIQLFSHDVLILPSTDGMKRNININNEKNNKTLADLKAAYQREFPKAFKNFKLVHSEIAHVDKKREVVRMIITHTTPGVPIRQVDYIIDVGAKRYFVSGTVLKTDGDKYDKVVEEFVKGMAPVAK